MKKFVLLVLASTVFAVGCEAPAPTKSETKVVDKSPGARTKGAVAEVTEAP